ncbi:MAG: polysaccharide deacetylase family protein [Flavobacterium sp.]|nr:polysaccharide deacetylase family protein [Flavobacterium sp.]
MYLVTTPKLLRAFYPNTLVWDIPTTEKIIYLTFDDGPHPTITPFVLDTLRQFNAKATFFCIGKNVMNNKAIYHQILYGGHAVGNHTSHHLKGSKTNIFVYLKDVSFAATKIQSNLFRPPYGSISKAQIKELSVSGWQLSFTNPVTKQLQTANHFNIIMWSVLSGDFDVKLSKEKCLKNVVNNAKQGSIVVFHDSEKAYQRMAYALPKVLEHFTNLGYRFEVITQ